MLIKDAFSILSEANLKIASLGSDIVDQARTPKQPKTIKQLIQVTSLYNILMEHILINEDGDAIVGTIGQSDSTLNKLLLCLKKAAGITSFPALPNPIHSFVTESCCGSSLPVGGSEGDLLYFHNGAWSSLAKGSDGDVLVSTPLSIQWQSVIGNGIPAGGSSGQFLIKNSNTPYDVIWDTLTLSQVSDVTSSAAEVNKLDGALWSTAESNTLVGINTGQSIQSQLNAKMSTSLLNGFFFVGNASNIAEAVAPSGDVVFDNTGQFIISAGVIINSDISTIAGIGRSKLAAGNINRIVINDASGVMTDASAITPNMVLVSDGNGIPTHSTTSATTLTYLDVTSSVQAQLNERLVVDISTPAQGDLIYYNGTDWVNLAIGTNGQVLTSNGTTVSWGSAAANGIPSGGTTNQYLRKIDNTNYNTEWHTFVLSDVTDISTTATELNVLSGIDTANLTSTKINYLINVNADIQDQLNNRLTNNLTFHSIWIGGAGNTAQQVSAGVDGSVLTIVSGHPTWQTPPTPGNVSGPVSSTDNAIVRWNGTAGNSIQNSGIIIDDSNNASGISSVTLSTGGALRTSTSNTNTVLLQAYDVDGAAYTTFATLTAGNTPTMDLSTSVTVGGAAIYRVGGTDVSLADGGTGASLSDPGADRILFWDDSAGQTTWLEIGTNLSISGTVLNATGGAGGYSTIEQNGSALTARTTLNVSNGLTAADDAGNTETTLKLGGTLTGNTSITGASTYDFNLDANNVLLSADANFDINASVITSTASSINNVRGNSSVQISVPSTSFAINVSSAGIQVNVGADATGDIHYRAATTGYFTRLPIGSTGQVLTVAAGIPSWASTAPVDAQYVTLAVNSTLTNERVLTPESGVLSLTDGGAGSNVTIGIAANGVSNDKIRQSVGLSVLGRSPNTTGNIADITASSDNTVLRRSGTSIGFGTIGISSMTMNTDRMLGRTTASAGAVEEITVSSGLTLSSGGLKLGGLIPGTVGSTLIEVEDNFSSNMFEIRGTVASATNYASFVVDSSGGSESVILKGVFSGTVEASIIFSSDGVGRCIFQNGSQNFSLEGDANNLTFTFVDNRTTKKGIEYLNAGYVTTDRSLTDRGYVLGSKTFAGSQTFRAGTATAGTAPLYIQSGTALTTPADGAMEYHSSHLYFTIGSTRYQLDQQGGITNSAANNEITKSNGTNIIGTKVFSSTNGDIVLGDTGLAGDRTISASSSTSPSNIIIKPFGVSGKVHIQPSSSVNFVKIGSNNIEFADASHGAIYGADISGAVGGNLYLDGGVGTSLGNIGLFNRTSVNFQSGQRIIHIGNATGAPTANPANGVYVYAADIVINSVLHIRNEAGDIIKLYAPNNGSPYSLTNVTTDRSYNADSTTLDELADVLGTLISDLKLTGLIA
jgi:hypothetical protein